MNLRQIFVWIISTRRLHCTSTKQKINNTTLSAAYARRTVLWSAKWRTALSNDRMMKGRRLWTGLLPSGLNYKSQTWGRNMSSTWIRSQSTSVCSQIELWSYKERGTCPADVPRTRQAVLPRPWLSQLREINWNPSSFSKEPEMEELFRGSFLPWRRRKGLASIAKKTRGKTRRIS